MESEVAGLDHMFTWDANVSDGTSVCCPKMRTPPYCFKGIKGLHGHLVQQVRHFL